MEISLGMSEFKCRCKHLRPSCTSGVIDNAIEKKEEYKKMPLKTVNGSMIIWWF